MYCRVQPLQQVDEELEQQVDYALVLPTVACCESVEEHDVYNVQVQVDEEQVLPVLSLSLHQLAQGLIWN